MCYNENLIKVAKDWFGDGQIDVDMMIGCGGITLDRIVSMYLKENNLSVDDLVRICDICGLGNGVSYIHNNTTYVRGNVWYKGLKYCNEIDVCISCYQDLRGVTLVDSNLEILHKVKDDADSLE